MAASRPIPLSDSNDVLGFLFPGQGSQQVGMTAGEVDLPAVKDLYDRAESTLGYDLRKIALEGPSTKLNATEFCQPALLIAGLAAVEKLKVRDPDAISRVEFVAGLSLGEYTALVHAGAMSVEDALRVVKIRAESMQAAGEAKQGCMLSVVGVDDSVLEVACSEAAAESGTPAVVANYLAPGIRVVSGHPSAIGLVETRVTPFAVKVQRLAVSGAFHSEMMASASDALRDILNEVVISTPAVPVIANTTGKPYQSAEEIRHELVKQVSHPVQWEASMRHIMKEKPGIKLYELGPQRQLKSMLRKLDPQAFRRAVNVTV